MRLIVQCGIDVYREFVAHHALEIMDVLLGIPVGTWKRVTLIKVCLVYRSRTWKSIAYTCKSPRGIFIDPVKAVSDPEYVDQVAGQLWERGTEEIKKYRNFLRSSKKYKSIVQKRITLY